MNYSITIVWLQVNYTEQSSILFHQCTTTVSLETTHLIALCEWPELNSMAKCSSFIRLPSLWGWSNEHQHIERDIEKGLLPFHWVPIYAHTWVERDNVESWWLLCGLKAHCHGMSMCRQPFYTQDACVEFQTNNWLNLFVGSVKATQTESYSDNWLWKQVRFIIWNMEFCWMDLCKIHVNYGCLATGEGTT